jgi:WD40 repeat protein
VNALYTREGHHLITCSYDHTVKVWDTDTFACVHTLADHEAEVTYIALSPDGSLLASASVDHTVRLWGLPGYEHVGTLVGHKDEVCMNTLMWSFFFFLTKC